MHDHPRRVEDAAEAGPPRRAELREYGVDERARLAAGPDVVSGSLEDFARGCDGELVRLGAEPLVGEQAVHGRQVAKPHREEV